MAVDIRVWGNLYQFLQVQMRAVAKHHAAMVQESQAEGDIAQALTIAGTLAQGVLLNFSVTAADPEADTLQELTFFLFRLLAGIVAEENFLAENARRLDISEDQAIAMTLAEGITSRFTVGFIHDAN